MIKDAEGFNRVLAYWKKRGANMFRIDREDERLVLRLIKQQVGDYFGGKAWRSKIDNMVVRELEVSPELSLPAEYYKGIQSL